MFLMWLLVQAETEWNQIFSSSRIKRELYLKEPRAAAEILAQYDIGCRKLYCVCNYLFLSLALSLVYLKQSIAYNDKLANSQVGGVIKADV